MRQKADVITMDFHRADHVIRAIEARGEVPMDHVVCDLWSAYDSGYRIVIPIPIGWDVHGYGLLRKGLALELAIRFSWAAEYVGSLCRRFDGDTPVIPLLHEPRVILFPIQSRSLRPHASDGYAADLDLINRCARQLADRCPGAPRTFVPHLGAGAGMRRIEEVDPILHRWLAQPHFTLVTKER